MGELIEYLCRPSLIPNGMIYVMSAILFIAGYFRKALDDR